MLVRPVYKCPLCGRLLTNGEPKDIPYDQLPNALAEFVKNQQFAGHPILYVAPMHIPCKCPDGNAGLATFAGFIKAKEVKAAQPELPRGGRT